MERALVGGPVQSRSLAHSQRLPHPSTHSHCPLRGIWRSQQYIERCSDRLTIVFTTDLRPQIMLDNSGRKTQLQGNASGVHDTNMPALAHSTNVPAPAEKAPLGLVHRKP